MRIAYPIHYEEREGVVWATFPDLPEASARGVSRERARRVARERLLAVFREYISARRDIPSPSPASRRRDVVAPPVLIAAKVALYQTMRDQKVTKVALAKRLGTVEGTVRRLVDLDHRSHVDAVEEALARLGKRLAMDLWVA